MLSTYLNVKRKKMNQKMTALADCISLEEPIPQELFEYIDKMGIIFELKAAAYRDLTSQAKGQNLYNYWHLY